MTVKRWRSSLPVGQSGGVLCSVGHPSDDAEDSGIPRQLQFELPSPQVQRFCLSLAAQCATLENVRSVCPYCAAQIIEISRDHIFPDFLGGTRKIPACATCNNKIFGARFESKAARQLLSFQLMLSSLGLSQIPLKQGVRWERAYEHHGELYDLEHRDGGPVLIRTKPKVIRDEHGRVISVEARSMKEVKALAVSRTREGLPVEIQEVSYRVPFEKRHFDFEFGPDFGRLAMKMSAALSSLLPHFDAADIQPAMRVLRGDETRVDEARRDFRPFPSVDNELPLLSHAIYVERGLTGLHGLVVLFGTIRMYCKLASRTTNREPCAAVGILDISTNQERFTPINPQGLTEAPLVIRTADHDRGCDIWANELKRQISEAGAEGWLVRGRMPCRPASVLWQSSTSDRMLQSWSSNTLGQQRPRRPKPKID
ncbi:HNH endonuclease [Paludibaculum fermentans]|uniref:HNH endonuclease 5 domain-containing protein n=1 Tax=Paludibaculum fermentans TaxID=1473598 RepID=A0A7S7NWD2_PALFE|nr:HNH endonuclease [Paludibaculum fermentans]QOY90971.1 hypothetical protein IRI77_13795 [Paludibaculum fermentans]